MSGILQYVLTPSRRIFRLFKFDQNVFGEIRDDSNEKLVTSISIIVVSSLLAGLGSFLYWEISGDPGITRTFINTFIFGSLFMTLLYIEGLLVTFVLLVQVFRMPVDLHALLCVGGYASFPLGLSLLMAIPVIYPLFSILSLCLLFLFLVIGMQEVCQEKSARVFLATLLGFATMVAALGIIAVLFSNPDAPIGAGPFGLFLKLS
tara:strand:+ start:3540 stop:4154 length:615 start_codon:yes stop_codon:yes gene_type:complete